MKYSKRHLAKTISWRLLGSLDTLILSWFIIGDFTFSLKISAWEIVSKSILYYIHERFWVNQNLRNSNKRHLLKTISWRAIGTLDTFIITWIITGKPYTGIQIGSIETITKMVLYYFHEKFWYKLDYGLDKRKLKNNAK